jgi:PTH1 family peptidyl-tRNA hydrolase
VLLWVGLGNPGPEHAKQRHNIGFMALDAIARRHGFSPWRKRFRGEVAEGSVGGVKVLALKPMTYMNGSGDAVQQAAGFHKIAPAAIWAFHDELDLAPGKVRVKKGGGIGHPGHKDRVTGHVLGNFAKVDTWVEPVLDAVADAAPLLAAGKAEDFMTRVALLTQAQEG